MNTGIIDLCGDCRCKFMLDIILNELKIKAPEMHVFRIVSMLLQRQIKSALTTEPGKGSMCMRLDTVSQLYIT